MQEAVFLDLFHFLLRGLGRRLAHKSGHHFLHMMWPHGLGSCPVTGRRTASQRAQVGKAVQEQMRVLFCFLLVCLLLFVLVIPLSSGRFTSGQLVSQMQEWDRTLSELGRRKQGEGRHSHRVSCWALTTLTRKALPLEGHWLPRDLGG